MANNQNFAYVQRFTDQLEDNNFVTQSGIRPVTNVQSDSDINNGDQHSGQDVPNYETLIKVVTVSQHIETVKQAADSQGESKKLYQCAYCKAKFVLKHHLTQHLQTHTGERPYKCTNCMAAFAQKHTLNRHNRTHTGEKPYKCGFCAAVFSLKHGLTQHSKIHTGEKPYKCERCNSKFSRKFSLDRHQKVHVKTHQ